MFKPLSKCIIAGPFALLFIASTSSVFACQKSQYIPLVAESDRLFAEYEVQIKIHKGMMDRVKTNGSTENYGKFCQSSENIEKLSREWLHQDMLVKVSCPDFWHFADRGKRNMMEKMNAGEQEIMEVCAREGLLD